MDDDRCYDNKADYGPDRGKQLVVGEIFAWQMVEWSFFGGVVGLEVFSGEDTGENSAHANGPEMATK